MKRNKPGFRIITAVVALLLTVSVVGEVSYFVSD